MKITKSFVHWRHLTIIVNIYTEWRWKSKLYNKRKKMFTALIYNVLKFQREFFRRFTRKMIDFLRCTVEMDVTCALKIRSSMKRSLKQCVRESWSLNVIKRRSETEISFSDFRFIFLFLKRFIDTIEKYNERLNAVQQIQHLKKNLLKERGIRLNCEIAKKQKFVTQQQKQWVKIQQRPKAICANWLLKNFTGITLASRETLLHETKQCKQSWRRKS